MAGNLENSPFSEFIGGLDLTGFSGRDDEVIAKTNEVETGIKSISSEGDKVFTYDVSVGMATIRTTLDTDGENGHYQLQFPSRLQYFEADDMLKTITCVIDAAYPHENYIPHVKVSNGERDEDFNLNSYWDGKNYEKALQGLPESLVYYIPGASFRVPQKEAAPFRYGFHRASEGDTIEFMRISHLGGRTMNHELAQELLSRNPGYAGKDIKQDAAELKAKLSELGMLHPKQLFGWPM